MNNNAMAYCPTTPAAPAQEFIRSRESYADVYAMAASLEKLFAASREKVVCLATENRAVIAAALLAALSGKVSLLLPNALSKRALSRMQQATGFGAAIADDEYRALLPPGTAVFWPQPGADDEFAPCFSYQSELICLFTGGTTGAPALWSKTGENLFAEAAFLAEYFAITDADCIVATVSPCHIYGLLFTVLLPLVSSATVLAETPSFPAEITEAVQENRATVLASVPAHYRALRHTAVNPGTLRFAVSSAGMLDPADNSAFAGKNNIPVIEVYGSTETGGIATRNRAAGEELFTPFPTVDWKIISSRLAVRSPYISSQTPLDEQGFFITGDRVERGPDNNFLLKGRVDTITKVGGKRVDLDEVREALKMQPGVEDCLVLSMNRQGGRGSQICALVQTADFHKEQIARGLQDCLEPYARPRVLRGVAAIPMTGAGKYDLVAIRQLLES